MLREIYFSWKRPIILTLKKVVRCISNTIHIHMSYKGFLSSPENKGIEDINVVKQMCTIIVRLLLARVVQC